MAAPVDVSVLLDIPKSIQVSIIMYYLFTCRLNRSIIKIKRKGCNIFVMARKTIFDIYDEVHAKDEKEKEFIPVNEVVKELSEEVKAVEEVKPIETPKEQPAIDLETINQNSTLQSVIENDERGE